MNPTPAAVLFDLDDTLHDDSLAYRRAAGIVATTMAPERGVVAERLLDAYVREADEFWQTLSPSAFTASLAGLRAKMWAAALREVGIDDDALAQRCAIAYDDARRGALELWPGVAELLAGLRAAGMKLGLITNGFVETHREKIEVLGLAASFDTVLIADDVGLLKPDPEIFLLAARRLGVAPERCVMVGDRFERDVAGAHAAGMRAVWLDLHGTGVAAGERAPEAVVDSIGAAAALLLPLPV